LTKSAMDDPEFAPERTFLADNADMQREEVTREGHLACQLARG